MTYVKTVWEDRLVEKPNNYTVTNNSDGTSSIIEAPGVVYVGGTPINAANLNKLEDAVSDIYESVDNLKLSGLNLLDNSNFDMGYYNKYPISNASTTLLTSATMNFLRISKSSASSSSITFNIPAAIADEFRPTEDFTLTLRYASTATVIIENTPNVIIVDGPKTLTTTTEPKVETVKMKFANTTSLKSIVFKIEGLTNQSIDIDWLCVTPGISGGYWIPSKNDLTTYSNELQGASAVNFNVFNKVGKFLIPHSATSLTNQPSDFILGKTAFLDVVGGDVLSGGGKLIQRLQQFENNKVWYRSVDGSNFGSWNGSNLPIATQAQAQAGADNTTIMTPLRVAESTLFKTLSGINDFNNITQSGRYSIGGGNLTLNLPPNFNAAVSCHLEVYNTNGNILPIQKLMQSSSGYAWIRGRQGSSASSSWTVWRRLDNDIATQAQAQTGTDNTNLMTPLRTKQAIDNSPIPRYGTATGTNALTITANPLFDNLYTGLTVKFKNTTANTGNVTINVNSKGSKPVLNNDGTQIQSGKLKANAMYEITYDGVNFYLTKGGGESSPIKRVQRGTSTINASDTTISLAVPSFNAGKSVLKIYSRISSASGGGTSSSNNILAEITNNTTLTFSRGNSSAYSVIVSWELIEYEEHVNVQRGTSVLSDTSLSVAINTVDLNKSQLFFSYKSSAIGEYTQNTTGIIVNGNTINFARASENGQNTINWFVVEMK